MLIDFFFLSQCCDKEYDWFYKYIGEDFESSLLSFEKLDRASPDLWPEQCKFDCLMLLNSTLYVTSTDVFTYDPKLHWLKYTKCIRLLQ